MNHFPTRIDLVRSLNAETAVEVGVLTGEFSAALLTVPSITKLFLVDAWKHFEGDYEKDPANVDQAGQDERYRQVRQRFENEPRIEIIRAESPDAAWHFAPGMDFVFIDADHTFPGVWGDLLAWSLVSDVLLLHDYTESKAAREMGFGVVEAVEEFCSAMQWKQVAITDEEWPTVMLVPR